jgi:hypothetical protein
MFEKLRRELLDRCDVIDQTRCRRAARHPDHRGFVELGLSQREAAIFLDRLDPQRPVAADARQDNADGAVFLILRKGGKKRVDRAAMLSRGGGHGNSQRVPFQGQRGIWRDHMNLFGGERRLILRVNNMHRGVRPKQFDQHAFVVRVEMLHKHKGHAGVGGHVVEEASKRGKTARGSSDPHHQRRRTSAGGARRIAAHIFQSFVVETLVSHAGNP